MALLYMTVHFMYGRETARTEGHDDTMTTPETQNSKRRSKTALAKSVGLGAAVAALVTYVLSPQGPADRTRLLFVCAELLQTEIPFERFDPEDLPGLDRDGF